MERLKAEIFIPCLTYSKIHDKQFKTNRGKRQLMDLIKCSKEANNENSIKLLLTKNQWNSYRKHFQVCRDVIEQAILKQSHDL